MYTGWEAFQCLHDLRAVADTCSKAIPRLSKLAHTSERKRIEAAITGHLSAPGTNPLNLNGRDQLRDVLVSGARFRDDDHETATLAICLLLTDAVEGNVGFNCPDQGWGDMQRFVRTLQAPRKAAILRSYNSLSRRSEYGIRPVVTPLSDAPAGPELLSFSADVLLVPLMAIARGMSKGDMEQVANADYGRDLKKHLGALQKTLVNPQCRFPQDDCWYPREVVELQAYAPDAAGFQACTALLIINDMLGDGYEGSLDFRWRKNHQAYLGLPEGVRNPILHGIRYLAERDFNTGWDPGWSRSKFKSLAVAIPYFDTYH